MNNLLFEIGVEELPAEFVQAALRQLPALIGAELKARRISCGEQRFYGTPRRLAMLLEDLAPKQEDIDEEVMGPPARVAFDANGAPTKAALAFAKKNNLPPDALRRTHTDKGEYLSARRQEVGSATSALLPEILEAVFRKIAFRKSMRWGGGSLTFGRPVRWLCCLHNDKPIKFRIETLVSSGTTYGHRFLAPDAVTLAGADQYLNTLRAVHVVADAEERRQEMLKALHSKAAGLGGTLIEDEFLVTENLNMVETPHVLVGSFEQRFLELPERVILDVAKGHQRYFGVRSKDGKLLPNYLVVANTAEAPENVIRGNDRVMRARLADAEFFFKEDLKRPLTERLKDLDGVVFHKRLGSVGQKVQRIRALTERLGKLLGLPEATLEGAQRAAEVAKCDLVTLMVGEFPELQGDMGRAYAKLQGMPPEVCNAIFEHYLPRGADDPTAPSDEGALVGLADRLDTLTGCFAVSLTPTGTADPLALRRAALGVLRTLLDRGWSLALDSAIAAAYPGFEGQKLDLDAASTASKLGEFLRDRLRGLLSEPQDVVDACLAADHRDPSDVRRRAAALAAIDPERRALVGEVFKRASNIATNAPEGLPTAPSEVTSAPHASEIALYDGILKLAKDLETHRNDHGAALKVIADFAPCLAQFFEDVFVMVEEAPLRDNRLRMMRRVHELCGALANFKLLAA